MTLRTPVCIDPPGPRVLVACEFSGVVRDAFIARGCDAVSCDLLPSERTGPHIQGDAIAAIRGGARSGGGWVAWDAVICFPPCTRLAVSGARWFAQYREEQAAAIAFVRALASEADATGAVWAIENPIGVLSTQWRRPDQIVQPWMFGHGETKATCVWLAGLPPLIPTNMVEGRFARVHREPPRPDRWKNRSRTYQGIADAMAAQWVPVLLARAERAA